MSLEQNAQGSNETQETINNNQKVESVVAPSTEEFKAKEDAKVERKTEDNKKIEEIRSELMGKVESNETHFMTKKYSSTNEGLNGLTGLYNDFPGIKGNIMFNESLPYMSLQTQDGEKFIIQRDPSHGFYIQGGADGKSTVHIKTLAEKMGREVESLKIELDNLIK